MYLSQIGTASAEITADLADFSLLYGVASRGKEGYRIPILNASPKQPHMSYPAHGFVVGDLVHNAGQRIIPAVFHRTAETYQKIQQLAHAGVCKSAAAENGE